MKLLISPAKKMREDGDFLAPRQAPALLERAERLDRAVGQARRGDTAVRSTGSPTGGTALSGLAVRQSGGWLERGEDHAAAVDRAFQRDSRRYDQGFALY